MKALLGFVFFIFLTLTSNSRSEDSALSTTSFDFNEDPLAGYNEAELSDSLAGGGTLKELYKEVYKVSEPQENRGESLEELISGDSFYSLSTSPTAEQFKAPDVYDSSVFKSGLNSNTSSYESSSELWTSSFNQNEFSLDSQVIPKESLTLFTQHKVEPLKINPLWYEEPTKYKAETADMPWGWSLEPKVPKESAKKGILDW